MPTPRTKENMLNNNRLKDSFTYKTVLHPLSCRRNLAGLLSSQENYTRIFYPWNVSIFAVICTGVEVSSCPGVVCQCACSKPNFAIRLVLHCYRNTEPAKKSDTELDASVLAQVFLLFTPTTQAVSSDWLIVLFDLSVFPRFIQAPSVCFDNREQIILSWIWDVLSLSPCCLFGNWPKYKHFGLLCSSENSLK